MAKKAGLQGMELVTANLNKELAKMTIQGAAGMQLAVALVRGDMEKTPPLVPISESRPGHVGGNLRASWFQEFPMIKGMPVAIFGFSANYAVFVHEMIGADVDWSRAGSGPKFLEAALKRNAPEILKLIGKPMKK